MSATTAFRAGDPVLPRILWVAAWPPAPPFSGQTGKALCGIAALAAATSVDVVTFAAPAAAERLAPAFAEYWRGLPVSVRWVAPTLRPGWPRALGSGRFQSGMARAVPALHAELERLDWANAERLLVLDDIVLAPLLVRYGANAVLSPHDCMSRMFGDHARYARWGADRWRYLASSLVARHYETAFYHRALLVHAITGHDRCLLEGVNSRARYAVAGNADLLNPGFRVDAPAERDVLVWGDLGLPSVARGAREFLEAAARAGLLSPATVRVAGRLDARAARQALGADLLSCVDYARRVEDESGRIVHARVTVIPDAGGTGMKNRCVNVLAAGRCLACAYSQMHGLESVCDVGAINARTPAALVAAIAAALADGSAEQIGLRGRQLYQRDCGEAASRRQWLELARQAVAVRAAAGVHRELAGR